MSDFRTKLLGLAALAIATAGLSSAQTIITCLQPVTGANNVVVGAANNPLNPATLRLESQTELVQDVTTQGGSCNATAPVPNSAIVYVTLSATITSKLTNAQTGQTDGCACCNPGRRSCCGARFSERYHPAPVSSPSTVLIALFRWGPSALRFSTFASMPRPLPVRQRPDRVREHREYVSNPNTTGSANLIAPQRPAGGLYTAEFGLWACGYAR